MMSGVFRNPGYDKHAITDVYDPKTRRILVRFPHGLLLTLGFTGVLAFGLMGYLGYGDDNSLLGQAFHKPWPLFLWFSALVFTLEVAVLRHPRLRRQLTEALVVTIICMVFVGFSALDPGLLRYILNNLLNIRIAIPQIGQSPWTYAILNFGVIIIFWLDTVRRWLRSQRGQPAARRIDLGFGTLEIGEATDLPTLPELIAGDLIAGGVLAALLSLIFRAEVINPIANALQIGVNITTCTVSWPIGHCVGGAGPLDPPTLSKMDLIQALIYLPLGFITLALTATANAFNAASDNPNGAPAATTPGTALATDGQSRAVSTDVLPVGEQSEKGRQSATVSVTGTIIDALRGALNRRIRIAIDNLLLALRNVVWPLFILLGMVALGQVARNIAFYLHLQSNQRTCALTSNAFPSQSVCQTSLQQLSQQLQYQNLASGVALVVAAGVALTLALMMLVFELRVADNIFRFLGLVTFIGALTLWIFSLALSFSNILFNLTGLTQRQPFPLFGASTTSSLLVFLISCAVLLIGKSRRARKLSRAQAPVGVGAGVGRG
ncbi:MAG TPA: hypothetical protein VE338_08745 [Ktedonobacterales bacterium]|jgi:hypothetical protein|nr:hypothetical protein [Ktedonobacterales bacterium]